MKLLSPVTYRSKQPSPKIANTMLDMVSQSPLYSSLSEQLKIALLKRTQHILLDEWVWSNLMEEYIQLKKRYEQYPFSYACFEALINETITNSVNHNQWKYTIQWWDDHENPWILSFTNPDHFIEFLSWLDWFNELCDESMSILLQTTRSATVQFLFEIIKDDLTDTYTFEYSLFMLMERWMQYTNPVKLHTFSGNTVDLQSLYILFMKFLPQGVSIKKGLYRMKHNQIIEKEQFDQRANDDEQYEYAQSFDPQLWLLLDAYRDRTVSQHNKEELFKRICTNEWWCFFIKQTKTMFTYSTYESIIKRRPLDTFRLFSPVKHWNKEVITYAWQQRNNEMKEMIKLLNYFLADKIKWRDVNKLNYEIFSLVIAWEIVDETITIAITFWWHEVWINYNSICSRQTFSMDEFYRFLITINCLDPSWEPVDSFYLWYEVDQDKNDYDEDYDDHDEWGN